MTAKLHICHGYPHIYNSVANIGAAITVRIPATAMERLLIAPSISPSSNAFAVPSACAEDPIAIPFATDSSILKTRQIVSANKFPVITVVDGIATVYRT